MPTRPTLAGIQRASSLDSTSGALSFNTPAATLVGDLLVHFSYLMRLDATAAQFDAMTLPSGWSWLFGGDGYLRADTGGAYPGILGVMYREANAAGAVAHSHNIGVTSDSGSHDRIAVTCAIRGHRPIGVAGGPFAASGSAVDASDVAGAVSRVVDGPSITPGSLDTLLLGFFASAITSTQGTVTGTVPTGMTLEQLYDNPTSSDNVIAMLASQALTAATATGTRSATLTNSLSRTWPHEMAAMLAIRAPNSAPGAPGAFTVPSAGQAVPKGTVLAVDWGDATDADGDTITYALDYRLNGGSWVSIATGIASSSYAWDTAAMVPGSYELRATPSDPWVAGTAVQSSAFSITVGGPRLIIG